MSTLLFRARHTTSSDRFAPRQSGFSMIELMIAILIALFLIGGIIVVEQGVHTAYGNQNGIAQLQDEERFAMTMLTDTISSAGYFPNPTLTSQPMPAIMAPIRSPANPAAAPTITTQPVSTPVAGSRPFRPAASVPQASSAVAATPRTKWRCRGSRAHRSSRASTMSSTCPIRAERKDLHGFFTRWRETLTRA